MWGYRTVRGRSKSALDREVDNCWRKMSVNCFRDRLFGGLDILTPRNSIGRCC